ncbi:glutamine synthetase beta-grasp domain-containing protein [Sunxiuqinia sp. A32]|uniref:glutamine synthetase beta-grasp domain-containing protein n=1 Tax=Sunxiuqinia sp. A32 TaxID=3461496 RepID=UPI004046761D
MSAIQINPNLLVQYLQKSANEFTREDIIRYIEERDIEMLNFRYVAEDGKLKTINFMVRGRDELEMVLSAGERVDGSCIFSFLEPNASDLFLVPRYKTAFQNPFSSIPSVDILCSFYDANGLPLESSPEYVLQKAQNQFFKTTGMQLKMMAELEYYVISDVPEDLKVSKNGYQCAEPFTIHEGLRVEAIRLIAQCGGLIRFGHAESGRFVLKGKIYEQHELEFSPSDPENSADQLVIAKWILRMLGQKYNVNVTFIPKITLGQPGSGLHFHFLAEQNGSNMLVENGELTSTSLKMIAGILDLSPALTAFANTTPISYLRLMTGEQTPNHICWGKCNRSTLVRVPLGWNQHLDLGATANNQEPQKVDHSFRQTIEYRGSDGGANPYLFSAALIVAFLKGFSNTESLKNSDRYFTENNEFQQEGVEDGEQFDILPMSCYESAEKLEEFRHFFEQDQIFPKSIVNHTILRLRSFNDKELISNFKTYGDESKEMDELIEEYLHYM